MHIKYKNILNSFNELHSDMSFLIPVEYSYESHESVTIATVPPTSVVFVQGERKVVITAGG